MVEFIEKATGILFRPVEIFQQLREESFGDAFVYYGVLLVMYAILSSLLSLVGFLLLLPWITLGGMIPRFGLLPAVFLPFFLVATILAFIIGLFVGGAILHLFVYLAGGRKEVEQTLKAVMYSSTPVFIFGWIPLVGVLALVYALILEILAVRELQEISTGRAILAVIAPFLLIFFLIILALALFLIVSTTSGPVRML
jgi:hypothetical protein